MKNKKELTKEELEMYLRAIMEKPIKVKDLYEEVLPLFEDCFVGGFTLTDEGIIMDTFNNQKFKITIEEIK